MRCTMNTIAMKRVRAPKGFTMLEVLISIVVISFGLLGIAGLQAFALKNNQGAGQRMTTTMLANDMVERVWSSNKNDRVLYNAPSLASYQTPVASCLTVAGCSTTDLVNNDLNEWQLRIAASLPSGAGIICQDASPDDGNNASAPGCDFATNAPFVVKIWWLDDRSATANAANPLQRFSWSFNP
jgi:type IV pilus assembly protein PilV